MCYFYDGGGGNTSKATANVFFLNNKRPRQMKHAKLIKAKTAKNDEFYTQYCDVENECQHYIKHFKDQWIYLPCDSEQSNFYKYFVDHFKEYGLKRLTATHINLDGTSSYRLDFDGSETLKTPLEGNGDFRSEECTKIKDECDIVITNPPFSLFRDFVYWLDGGTFSKNNDGSYVRE